MLSWELSQRPIDFAEEAGNMVVHFARDNVPVLVEILEASKFLAHAETIVAEKSHRIGGNAAPKFSGQAIRWISGQFLGMMASWRS